MENKLKEKSRDEEDDESSPEARDQKEKGEGSIDADIVTTVLGEMSLSCSKKDQEQDKDVISSQDFNLPSDESNRSWNESEKKIEENVSILPPHYFPHSNLISSRIVSDSGSQKKIDNDELDKRDQDTSLHSGASQVTGQQDSVDLHDEERKKIGWKADLDLCSQSLDTVDHSSDANSNVSEQEVHSKQIGHLEVTEEGNEAEEECGDCLSETEHNFLDQGANEYHEKNINIQHFEASDLPVKAAVHYRDDFDDEEHSECDFPPPPPESPSLKSEPLRPSNKGPAPQPPTAGLYERSQSAAEVAGGPGPGRFGGPCGYNQHVCPTALLKYQQTQPPRIHFLQLGYNTNLRKPPENWLRMKRRYHAGPKADGPSHGTRSTARHSSYHYSSHLWSTYSLSHSSWSMFSSFRYSIPSSWRARKNFFSHTHSRASGGMANFDFSLCMCCVCCNCAKINQTNCCCCYHCVHTVSACRRSDLIRQAQREAQTKGLFGTSPPPSITPVSILKKKGGGGGTKMLTDRVSDGSQVNLIKADVSEDEDQFKPFPAPIFAFCPSKKATTPSPEPSSYPLISSEDNSARPDFEMSPDHSPNKYLGSELLTVNNNSIGSIVDEDAVLISVDRGIRIA